MTLSRSLVGWVLLVMLAGVASSCDGGKEMRASREECRRVHDHVVDLQLGLAGKPQPSDDSARAALERHRAILRGAVSERFLERCEAERSAVFIDCALKAMSLDEVRACEKEERDVASSRS